MKSTIAIFVSVASILLAGCATPAKHGIDALQGTWKGKEVTPNQEGSGSLTFTGNIMDYHGAGENDWAKGTIVVNDQVEPHQIVATFTDGPSQNMIGQKCCIIYKIEDGALTVAGNPPGDDHFPARFDADGAREFLLKHE